MDFQILPIMPEPLGIFSIPFEKHLEFKKIAKFILETANDDLRRKNQTSNDLLEHICDGKNQDIFSNFKQLNPLRLLLEEYTLKYLNEIGFVCEEVITTDAWLNCGSKNANQNPHLHANSYISGTYYINFDPKMHGLLNLFNDRLINGTERKPFLILPTNNNKPTPYNVQNIQINCKEGDVLLWRSHILHGFNNNRANNRLTLSFNTMPKTCSDGNMYSFSISR